MGLIQQRLVALRDKLRSVELAAHHTQLVTLLAAATLIAVLLSFGDIGDAPQADAAQTAHPALSFLLRYLYWFTHSIGGLLVMSMVTRLLSAAGPAALPQWLQLLIASLAGALVFAPLALSLELLFAAIGYGDSDAGSVRQLLSPALVLGEFIELAPAFVACWLLLNFGYQSLQPTQMPTAPPSSDSANLSVNLSASQSATTPLNTPPTGLLALLPPALGQDLVAISSDLNYVHVSTQTGKTMVLYSLSRAAAELSDRGLQVHRSHWVSFAAVVAVRRTHQGLRLELIDGSEIPVSRRKERAVRDEFGAVFQRSKKT